MPALLLLDADRNARRAMEIALRLEGVEVAGAEAVAEATTLLAARCYDLVAVDSLVPDWESAVASLVAQRIPVVVTGPHPELLSRASRRYGVDTLEKPLVPRDLLAAIPPRPARLSRDAA